jgi:hypothetical protein
MSVYERAVFQPYVMRCLSIEDVTAFVRNAHTRLQNGTVLEMHRVSASARSPGDRRCRRCAIAVAMPA